MFNRRRLPLVVAGACLLLASGASAAEPNAFTAALNPTHVKPATSVSYTFTLTNNPTSPKEADKAKIGIPTDFVVDEATVQASAGAAGDCVASTWVADGALITGGKINLTRPGGGPNNRLCPGAALTVVFFATSAVAEGSYTWATELLRGEEAFALNGFQPTVVVDGTAPNTSVDSGPPAATNQTTASFSFSSNELGSTFQCSRDGAAFTTCTSPMSYTGIGPDAHTFEVRATDLAGNTDATPASHSWKIDLTAPNTSVDSGPPAATNQTTASFSFSSNELGSTFQCSRDGAAFTTCSSPQAYSGLAESAHTFAVRAIDPVGNTDATPASHSWKIDLTAPNTSVDSGPPAATNQTSASFTFASSEPGSTFQCRLDGAAFAACPTEPYAGLAEGQHTFRVRATDPAGNTDATPAIHSWTIDTTAPNTTIDSGQPPTPTNKTSASFSFTSSEAGSTFECSRDNEAFAPCMSPKSYSGLPGGARTFLVRATDPAGNTDGSPATHTWTIDLTGAATTILTAPPSSTNSTSASFTFASSEPGTTFACSLDGALFTPCSSPAAYNNLADGQYTFTVRATDAAGNTGPETSHSWTIETRAPTASVASGPTALSNSRSATFAFSADEPSSFQCQLDGGSFQPCSSPASYEGLGDGAHAFAVRPTDAVGNTGASSSYGWTIDATAPETTLGSGPPPGTTALSATFTFSASEPAGFQCKLDGAAFAPCTSPTSHAGLSRSEHTFEVRAIDAAGNPDPTPAVHRWTIAATPRSAKATSALLAPRAGARVTSPPLLVWRRAARASYYNVQLYRGRVKVLSAWPAGTRLQLRARWTYLARQRRLSPGAYRWYVWPGYGRASARRYGSLLGQSTFTVAAPARR